MYKRFDPFEGMTPGERAQKIFRPNKTYNDDIVELIDFLGGETNIKTVKYADKKDLELLKNFDATSSFVVINVNNFAQTKFNCCSLRTFNAYLDCFHIDQKIYVEYKLELKSFMDQWVSFHKELELKQLKQRQEYVKEINEKTAAKE